MEHFKQFCDIYCEENYKLKKEIFSEQKYKSKSKKSFLNFIIKQKIKEKIYSSYLNQDEIPDHLSKIFSINQLKNFAVHRDKKTNILKKPKAQLKVILNKLTKKFPDNNFSYNEIFDELDRSNFKQIITKDLSIYTSPVDKVLRYRKQIKEYILKNDIYFGIFYILIWGGHKELSILDTLISFEENKLLIKRLSLMLREGKVSTEECYNALKNIKGLGPAYFTKIMYFYSHSYKVCWQEQTYIMDQFTAKSMNLLRASYIKNEINLSNDILNINKFGSLDGNTNYIKYKYFNDDIRKLTAFFKNHSNHSINEELIEVMLFGQPYDKKDNINNSPHKLWRRYIKENYQ
jgi:hypothetical protein